MEGTGEQGIFGDAEHVGSHNLDELTGPELITFEIKMPDYYAALKIWTKIRGFIFASHENILSIKKSFVSDEWLQPLSI